MKKIYYLSTCDTNKRILKELNLPKDFIKQDLEDRLTYLNYILLHPDCSVEDFKKDTGITFLGKKSHKHNTNKEVKKW